MSDLVPFRMPGTENPEGVPAVRRVDAYGALLADAKSPATARARVQDLTDLARYLNLADPEKAAALMIQGNAAQANTLALGYFRRMLDSGLSASTINRRLSTLRRLVKLSRRLGLVDWALDVDTMKSTPYRDTAGPGHDGWLILLAVATAFAFGGSKRGRRDLAIVRLLHDAGLRRGELVGLDLADVDLANRKVAIVGKGRTERQWWTINKPTAEALARWIEARPAGKGPLFTRLDNGSGGRLSRLTADWIHEVVGRLGRKACLSRPARPHGLRHAGATRLLDITNGNVRLVQRWTRHSKLETVAIYDDSREDHAGKLADRLGEDLPAGP
jgi:integrase/recombinase XerC